MQSLSPTTAGYNISATFSNMIKNEGLFRPVRGLTAVVVGAGPAHALYFASYEFAKESLTKLTTHHHQLNYGELITIYLNSINTYRNVFSNIWCGCNFNS